MRLFINKQTKQFPCYEGKVSLLGEENFEEVFDVTPSYDEKTHTLGAWSEPTYNTTTKRLEAEREVVAFLQHQIQRRLDEKWEDIRSKRDALLAETDFRETPSMIARQTDVENTAWMEYRNALRDLPSTVPADKPETIVWPDTPVTTE